MSSIRCMPCSRSSGGVGRLLLALSGICYPFAVYAAMDRVPAGLFVLAALALILARMAMLRGHAWLRILLGPLLAAMAATILLALVDPDLGAKSYPVLMSLCFAAAFGISLLRPPSLVEMIARMRQPDLPAAGICYTRRVSLVWFVFLLVNAAISAATALSGDLALWTLYNGLIAYLLSGLLFGGEMLVRRRVMLRSAA